jgi:hypothetical protein
MVRKPATTKRRTTKPTTARRRKSVPRKKGMLSELFNPVMAQAGGKAVLSGAVGGAGAGLLMKLLPDTMDPKMKSFYIIGGGFLSATMLKMPNLGAGMAGVGMFQLLTGAGFLAEDSGSYGYADEIENLPVLLNENGMQYLQENAYLQESGYLQEDNSGLSYDVGYYGAGFGMDNNNF